MIRRAVLAFPDDQGVPQARMVLERVRYEEGPSRTAAWLMCNPSTADALQDDPTAGRVVHHSWRAGCGRSLVGNVWPLRTPYPAELWPRLTDKSLRPMMAANHDALAMIGGQADIHVVAFGAEPMRRYEIDVFHALEAFSMEFTVPLYCLGTTDRNEPLHPLARGKMAIRNDTDLRLWVPPW